MVRFKRGADCGVGDEILVRPGEVFTVDQVPLVLDNGHVIIATDRGLLSGGLDSEVRVVAEGWSE